MKVMWVVNTIFPDLAEFLGQQKPVIGGWMYGLAKGLSNRGIELVVVTAKKDTTVNDKKIKGISYYVLANKKDTIVYDSTLEKKWEIIVSQIKPDVIHIHGTELSHGLALVNKFPNLNYIASIQGLIGVYSRYYLAGLTNIEVFKNLTIRDVLKRDGIKAGKKKFVNRGKKIETQYFQKINHVIGRTDWDFAHAKAYNSNINYHFCNESLRDSFYENKKWSYNECEPFTIFLSQAAYPIKGLHQVIKAIQYLIKDYPDLKIKIAGKNIISNSSLKERLRLTSYGNYIRKLTKNLKLDNYVEFLGLLSEEEMIKNYLKCNVFVCPSSIENSPNSLGEAQLLGTPCIASFVGGVSNMLSHEDTGLTYRFEENEMLACELRKLFENKNLAETLGSNGQLAARKRHDRETNLNQLIAIYNKIAF